MSATRRFTIALRAAVVLLAGQAFASSAQAELVWGVNGHPLVSYPGVSIAEQLDAVRDLGLTSYRVDIAGPEKVAALHELVREGNVRGIAVLPLITPAFDLDKETPEVLQKKAYDLAFSLVSEFKGQIEVWELGNELDNYAVLKRCESRDNGTPRICLLGDASGKSPDDYSKVRWAKASAVLKGLTQGAHAADPSVRRAIGTAGWGHIGAFELMKADGISWDISIWHMYGEDPEWAFKKLARYERPIWVTEFNNPLGSQRGKDQQVEGLLKQMDRLRELQKTYDIEAAHIYELLDEPYWGGHYEAYMGLVQMTKDGNGGWKAADKKPAYTAVKQYIERIGARPARKIAIHRNCEIRPAAGAPALPAKDVITYAYCLVLGRAPDGAGLVSWSQRLARDMSVEQILIAMMNSDEFAKLYDLRQLSRRDYVILMYRLLLDVDPVRPVLAQAAADLESGKPGAALQQVLIRSKEFRALHPTLFVKLGPVAQAQVEPPVGSKAVPAKAPQARRSCDPSVMSRPLEFERGQVIYSYCLVLGRWPDSYGLRTWTAQMRQYGLPLEGLLQGLLESGEFSMKYDIDALDDSSFVTLLYRVLLGRDPDGQGLESYVLRLANGSLSRPQLYQTLVTSGEFRAKHEALFTARMPARVRADAQK